MKIGQPELTQPNQDFEMFFSSGTNEINGLGCGPKVLKSVSANNAKKRWPFFKSDVKLHLPDYARV